MRHLKVFLTISVFALSGSLAEAQVETLRKTSCSEMLPAGLVIRVQPDERIIAGRTDGPLLLTVASDVRLFPGKAPIVPRSSKVFAKTIESKEAGHLWGRARYKMTIDSILTPNGCEYALEGKLVEAGQYKVRKDTVIGNGHAARDFLLWLFPPTTLYQFIRLPGRGPRLVLDEETTLAIRLLQPVLLQVSEKDPGSLREAVLALPEAPQKVEPVQVAAADCPEKQPDLHNPISYGNGVMRPFRNTTRYVVTVAIGKETVARLGPCFVSMVNTPMGEFTMSAQAAVLEGEGQHSVPLQLTVNSTGTGWDIVNRPTATVAKGLAARMQPQ